MTLQFFWSRTASVWIALLYMLLGIPLLLFPGISGSVFVWTLAAGAAVYAISHLWRYLQERKTGQASGGDLFLTILPMSFAIFSILWPQAILSFLPLVLGALLLVDGVGKIPLVIAAVQAKSSILIPLLLSSLIPGILGVLLAGVVWTYRLAPYLLQQMKKVSAKRAQAAATGLAVLLAFDIALSAAAFFRMDERSRGQLPSNNLEFILDTWYDDDAMQQRYQNMTLPFSTP